MPGSRSRTGLERERRGQCTSAGRRARAFFVSTLTCQTLPLDAEGPVIPNDNRTPVTVKALADRLHPVLRKEGKVLRQKSRSPGMRNRDGWYTALSGVTPERANDVDLEQLGRDLGVLNPSERLVE